MSVNRDHHGDIAFECDGCEDTFEAESTDFYDALAELKRNGWAVVKVGSGWEHRCPDCRKVAA